MMVGLTNAGDAYTTSVIQRGNGGGNILAECRELRDCGERQIRWLISACIQEGLQGANQPGRCVLNARRETRGDIQPAGQGVTLQGSCEFRHPR